MEFFHCWWRADELGAGYLVLSKCCVMGEGDGSKPRETRNHLLLLTSLLSTLKTHGPLIKCLKHSGTTMPFFAKCFSSESPRQTQPGERRPNLEESSFVCVKMEKKRTDLILNY